MVFVFKELSKIVASFRLGWKFKMSMLSFRATISRFLESHFTFTLPIHNFHFLARKQKVVCLFKPFSQYYFGSVTDNDFNLQLLISLRLQNKSKAADRGWKVAEDIFSYGCYLNCSRMIHTFLLPACWSWFYDLVHDVKRENFVYYIWRPSVVTSLPFERFGETNEQFNKLIE